MTRRADRRSLRGAGRLALLGLFVVAGATACDEKTGEFYLPADLGVPPNGAIEGRVTDPSGEGLSNVTLTRSNGTTRTTTTDATGNYAFTGVTPGTHTVTVTPPQDRSCTPGGRTVAVTAGATAQADFVCVLQPGSITGTVQTDDGSPISGATVSLDGSGVMRTATTGSDGSFAFEDLPPGTYALSATSTDRTCGEQTANVESGEATPVTITCEPEPGSVSGTVTTNGVAESGVTVRVFQNGTEVGSAQTNDQGAYSIGGVPAGAIQIVFESTPAAPIECGSTTRTAQMSAGGSVTANLECALGQGNFSASDLPDGAQPQGQDIPLPVRVNGLLLGQLFFSFGGPNFSDASGVFVDPPGLLVRLAALQLFLRYYVAVEFLLEASGLGSACALNVAGLDAGGETLDEIQLSAIEAGRIRRTLIAGIVAYHLTFRDLQQNGCSGAFLRVFGGRFQPLEMSSARFKDDVTWLLPDDRTVLGLRPAVFRYREPWGDPDVPRLGLLAEQVVEAYPTAVARDADGRPEGIYYRGLAWQVYREAGDRVRDHAAALADRASEAVRRGVLGREGARAAPDW